MTGVEFSFGADREVRVRSAGLFIGYHRDETSTRQVLSADGWLRTGDAGFLGQDGQLHVVGRLKDMGTLRDGSLFAPQAIESKLRFSPYVKEAVAVGDQRDAVCAIVNIDAAAVGLWADRQGISYTGYADLASRDEVYGLIAECLASANADLARDPATANCQVKRFLILQKEFDADDGELTRLRKLRRGVIAERYRPLIEGLYQGVSSVRIDAEVRYEDGRVGTVSADVKIRDAKTTHASPVKEAA
jgi:long-chain acyl-CoA synthetase